MHCDNTKSAAVTDDDVRSYIGFLGHVVSSVKVTDAAGETLKLGETVQALVLTFRSTHEAGNKLIFCGNGGSAAIASHMATDYSKNGGMRSWSMNDGSMLTCLGNDLGYENVFAKQIELHARSGDSLIAISSSGNSPNILRAVDAARTAGCRVVTLSGFKPDNKLRRTGDVNFYLEADQYGYVEIGHLVLCHTILDFACGLRPPVPTACV